MKALITGASSGIGREFAIKLSEIGYDLILISRNKKELEILSKTLNTNIEIMPIDLSKSENCYKVYKKYKNDNIDLLINNAGFGVFGTFFETQLDKELEMIDVNINAVHILTKLFLAKFLEKDNGYIVNVSSLAAFQPGPLMATYYSTKSYVYNLTCAIYEELKKINSKVNISVLCPGPVNTNFNKVAGVEFGIKPLSTKYVVEYTLKSLKKRKLIIVPGFTNKLSSILGKFIPTKLLLKITYNIQKKKVTK